MEATTLEIAQKAATGFSEATSQGLGGAHVKSVLAYGLGAAEAFANLLRERERTASWPAPTLVASISS